MSHSVPRAGCKHRPDEGICWVEGTELLNCVWNIFENLARFLVVTHFLDTLPLQVPRGEDFKVESVVQQVAS